MAKDPAFLFYTNDFDAATKFFSDEQVGIYLRLLIAHHQHGRLKESQVKFICKSMDADILSKFKVDENGLYYNDRLEEEVCKRKKHSEKQKENIAKRYQTSTKLLPNYLPNGYQKIDLVIPLEIENENESIVLNTQNFKTMPLPEDLPNILPDIKIGAAKELLKLTKQVDVSNAKLTGMWNVFKVQNLTGKKWYANIDAVYSHYINWIKSQKFETETVYQSAPVKNITEIVDKYNNYDKELLKKSANA